MFMKSAAVFLLILPVFDSMHGIPVELDASSNKVFIDAGAYNVGCSVGDKHCNEDEGQSGGVEVYVPAFTIDKYETSVAEYKECVVSGHCEKPFDYKRTHYCNYDAPQRGNYPVNCVDWEKANNYCHWKGGRLAYEVEWEKAARGGANTPYPWGNESANCEYAVMDPGKPGDDDFETDGCWRDLSWPRNSFPPNGYGLYDMVGGTSEWVMDWYDINVHDRYYKNKQLTGPRSGKLKTIKGGSWDEKFWAQRVTNRFAKPITGNPDLYGSNGIRCVYPHQDSLK